MKFNKLLLPLSITLIAIFVVFTACDSTNSDGINGNARFQVELTDAPASYDAVFIDIQEVRIKADDFEDDDVNEEGEEDDEGEWITLNEDPIRVDLLELRNGNTIQLGDEEVEAGEYNQIRFVLGPDNAVVIDGETFDLETPSAQQSGLKLNIDAVVEGGEIYNLLVDFDAGRSIVETGNGKFILKPVLRAVELEETGTISGTVSPDSIQTSVMAITNGDTLSTLTGEDGAFSIIGVTPGTYNVAFKPSSDVFADTTITDVSVSGDEDTELGTISLPQE